LSELGSHPVNKLRFAFWGSSEAGNEGSGHHLLSMDAGELSNIAAYLDFSIIGSPNFARFVYDGDSAASATAGSAEIEQMFLDYFAIEAGGLPNEPFSESTSGYHSDLLNFALAGKPVGGLFTGTTGIKSPTQASTYGGTSGNQFDPCNHLPCDTFDNVSLTALDQMSDAVAHAIYLYAEDGRYIPVPVWSRTGMSLAVLLMGLFGFVHLRRRVEV
jgi:Zn-dependent M28 family amino/carboxypeptidase